MRDRLARLRRDEDGAVTVDWVVLTAAIGVMGFVLAAQVLTGATGVSERTAATIATVETRQ